jgi:hypothetical protein
VICTSLQQHLAGVTPRRPDAPRRAAPARVALAEWWRAMTRVVHAAWCLPELGGCPEELIDTREPVSSGGRSSA